MLTPGKKSHDQPRQHIKKQTLKKRERHYFVNKDLSSQGYGLSSSHVWIWELDYKESWTQKNWCFWTVVLEKLLRVPWTARRSNQSILKDWRILRNINWKDWCWSSNNLATWCEEPSYWKRPWCWERLKAGVEGRGWDGWMASLTRWTWFWASSMS